MSSVVLLRGLTREARHWGEFPQILQRQLPDARLIALDLPGSGQCNHLRSPTRVHDIMALCRSQLPATGAPPPYLLVALSLGAMVAVAWAERHPSELLGAVLINTSLRPISAFYRRLRPHNYWPLLRAGLLGNDLERREHLVLRLTSRRRADEASVLRDWIRIASDRPVARGTALRQLLAATRYRAPPRRPDLPLLLLAGAGDTLVDPLCSRQLAARWRCALAVHEAAGHDLPLDDGAWVARQIGTWIAAQPALARALPPAPASGIG